MSATQNDSTVTEHMSEGARLTVLLLLEQSADTLKLNTLDGVRQFSECSGSERERVMFELRKAYNDRPEPQNTAARSSEWWRSVVELVTQATNKKHDFGREKPLAGKELLSLLPAHLHETVSYHQNASKESDVSTSFLLRQGLNASPNSAAGEHLWKITLSASMEDTKDWIAGIAEGASNDYFASRLLADCLAWLDSRDLGDGDNVRSVLRAVGSIAGYEKLCHVNASLSGGAGPKRDVVANLSAALGYTLLFTLGSILYSEELCRM